MNKLLVTLGLCAAVLGSVAAAPSPAGASPTLPLPPPRAELFDLQIQEAQSLPSIPTGPIFLRRAELTTQLVAIPGPYSRLWHIKCVVTNSGVLASGPFQTLITRVYAGTPQLPGPAIATPIAMPSIPAGGQFEVMWNEHIFGPLQIGAYADFTNVVPEYNEMNNDAHLIVSP